MKKKILFSFCFFCLFLNLNSKGVEDLKYIKKEVEQLGDSTCSLSYYLKEYEFENKSASSYQFISTQKKDELDEVILKKVKSKMYNSILATPVMLLEISFDKEVEILKISFLMNTCEKSDIFDKEINCFIEELSNLDLSRYIYIDKLDRFNYGSYFFVIRNE